MPATRLMQKAPPVGAFFMLAAWLAPALLLADNCRPPAEAERTTVRFVHDGDTLVLGNQSRVRLIGLNAPEVARGDQPAQALAIRARDHLRQLLFQAGNQALLLPGRQPRDRHNRTLAHLWLPDGTNLSAELLDEGLGWTIAVPPNTRFLDCHSAAETRARDERRGVWKLDTYKAKASHKLSMRTQGFQRIRGRVVRVNRGGGATWINLQGRFAIRIPDKHLSQFDKKPGRKWVGRELEVRGWVYQSKGQLRVTVGHPANLMLF